ncbi:hypothetical protein BABINDRAFT_162713 [Babjeviella inositovora NRRL Y-12698]|uniref:Methyltransferase type 11 domain-containing protein n=1 Tax=Babjeviella inositovora NRRL Y-12698 TaxID=984486 RepID=A0A1E3QLE2_9ASCO|nr:uncharacterized protein BABINDRAFT_162713 [Babjeviella inositovora NRRL Y-12698]ODQ78503.1 hypothetical protein BABINDRAFT_162713 [Babjeviella inositovora NRRL Y-12698]
MSTKPNATAINSFNENNLLYDQLRPNFPQVFVDDLLVDAGVASSPREYNHSKVILELAAGTGKFTRNLIDAGWGAKGSSNLIIVEPSTGMLGKFRENFPSVDARLGSSYELPMADSSVDAIFVSQGFHWFSDEQSLKELSRVLKPNGRFACIWNFDYPSVPQNLSHENTPYSIKTDEHLHAQVSQLIANTAVSKTAPYEISQQVFATNAPWQLGMFPIIAARDTVVPQYRHGNWRTVFNTYEDKYFTPILKEGFYFRLDRIDWDLVYPYWETRSYITSLPETEKLQVKAEVEAVLEAKVDRERDMYDAKGIKRVLGTHYVVTKPI